MESNQLRGRLLLLCILPSVRIVKRFEKLSDKEIEKVKKYNSRNVCGLN